MIYWKCIVWKRKSADEPRVTITFFGENISQLNTITDTIKSYWDIGRMALHYKQKKQDSIPDIIKDMMFVHMIFIASSNRLPSNSTLNMREEDEYIFPISSKAEKKFYSSNTTNLRWVLNQRQTMFWNQKWKLQYDQHLAIVANEWNAVYAYRERLANLSKRKSEGIYGMGRSKSKRSSRASAPRVARESNAALNWTMSVLIYTMPYSNSKPNWSNSAYSGESTEAYILRMQSLRTWTSTTSSQSA